MNDCTNAEIRDQLPDLLHERLDAPARALVLAHVDGCMDCRDELRLLREVRASIESRTPRVDVNYVLGALPKPPAQRPALGIAPRRRMWADWRVAAAVTLLVAGGSSVALLGRDNGAQPAASVAASSPATMSAPAAPAASAQAAQAAQANPVTETASAASGASGDARSASGSPSQAVAAVNAQRATDVATDANLSNLDERQLKALLQDIDGLRAVPVAEPEPVSLRIDARTSGEL